MRNAIYCLVATTVSTFASPVSAADFDGYGTGNKLLATCESTIFYTVSDCLPYIAGAIDMGELDVTGQPKRWCRGPGVSLGQQKDIIIKYLKDHPERRHFPSGALVWQAMREAFPC